MNVLLYDLVGLALIIAAPTGVTYQNQTGGTACLQPKIEGALVPIRNDILLPDWTLESPERELNEYFEGPAHKGTGATGGLSVDDADLIDTVLETWNLLWIRVDRARLKDSHEAWIHVRLTRFDDAGLITGPITFPAQAVLTWANSD